MTPKTFETYIIRQNIIGNLVMTPIPVWGVQKQNSALRRPHSESGCITLHLYVT